MVDFLLRDGSFAVRALTRFPESAAADGMWHAHTEARSNFADLSERGVEVYCADYADPASLRAAFQGAHGVFGMTDCSSLRLSRLRAS